MDEHCLGLLQEENETVLLIVNLFLPQVFPFLVAPAGSRAVDAAAVNLVTYLESQEHNEGVAGEGF